MKCRNNGGVKYGDKGGGNHKNNWEVSTGKMQERSIGTIGEGSKGTVFEGIISITGEGCIWTTREGSTGALGQRKWEV